MGEEWLVDSGAWRYRIEVSGSAKVCVRSVTCIRTFMDVPGAWACRPDGQRRVFKGRNSGRNYNNESMAWTMTAHILGNGDRTYRERGRREFSTDTYGTFSVFKRHAVRATVEIRFHTCWTRVSNVIIKYDHIWTFVTGMRATDKVYFEKNHKTIEKISESSVTNTQFKIKIFLFEFLRFLIFLYVGASGIFFRRLMYAP